jgi:tRNA(fMet)-specific endonuclease VapC
VDVKRLLDTNAYTAAKRGRQPTLEILRTSSSIVLPTVVVAELLFGFRNGSQYASNARDLSDFLSQSRVELAVTTWTTCDRYARVAAGLRARGTPIPTNDIWVAAHAMELGAELVSYDRHFEHVSGLAWILPSDGVG